MKPRYVVGIRGYTNFEFQDTTLRYVNSFKNVLLPQCPFVSNHHKDVSTKHRKRIRWYFKKNI